MYLPKPALFKIALEYDLPEILNFCQVSKKHRIAVCDSDLFWTEKLKKDFDMTDSDPKQFYFYTYRLKNVLQRPMIDYIDSLQIRKYVDAEKLLRDYYRDVLILFQQLYRDEDRSNYENNYHDYEGPELADKYFSNEFHNYRYNELQEIAMENAFRIVRETEGVL